jgi:surface protein
MINNEEDSGPINVFQITAGETLVTKVLNWGTTAWNNLTAAFSGCTNLTTLEDSALTTDSNGDMYDCFNGCTGLTTVNGKKWNLSAGARIGRWFNGCTNLELLDLTGVSINLIEASDDAFQSSGSATTNGCEFKLSGVTLTQSSSLSHDDWFKSTKLKPTSTFANITWPSTRFNAISWFYDAVMTGTNSVLDCSGWTTFKGELSYWFSRFNNAGGGVSPSNTNQKINLTNFSGDLLAGGLTEFMANSAVSRIIGLSTWGATSGTPISFSRAFLGARVFAIDASDNFSNTFMSSAVVNDMTGFYANVGDDYNGTPVSGVAPNLTGLDVSNATSFSQAFMSTRLTSNIDFNNITYGSAAYNFGQTFQAYYGQTYAGSHIDFSNATLKISSLSSTFFSYGTEVLEKITFGNNVDFSELTSFSHTFYRTGMGSNGTIVELPTNADYSAVTNVTNMFFNTNYPYTIPSLSTCQVDYFIRNLYSSRQSLGAGGALTINMPGMSITEAPSVVRSTLDDLVALGYNIGLGAADATLPFAYPAYFVDRDVYSSITPTTFPAGSTFTSSNASMPIVASTGVVSWASNFSGESIIRCTYPDGCYNEVNMLVGVPMKMTFRMPVGSLSANVGYSNAVRTNEFVIDWGDGSLGDQSSNTHTYASDGDYTVSVFKNYDPSMGSRSYLLSVDKWGEYNHYLGGNAFLNSSNFDVLATDSCILHGTSLANCFKGCGSLTNANNSIGNWDVSGITNMNSMFRAAVNFNADISQWVTTNVTDMAYMFMGQHYRGPYPAFNQDINTKLRSDGTLAWDTQNVTTFAGMFIYSYAFDKNIGNWNTDSLTNMSGFRYMFTSGASWPNNDMSTKQVTLGTHTYIAWDVANVTSFSSAFGASTSRGASANGVSNWNTSSATNMYSMFGGSGTDDSSWDLSKRTVTVGTGATARTYTAWDTSNVTTMGNMFYAFANANNAYIQGLSNWDTSSLTNIVQIFRDFEEANVDLNSWNTSNLQDAERMIFGGRYTTPQMDQSFSNWNMTSFTGTFGNWASSYQAQNGSISIANYDATLTSWGAQSVNSGVDMQMGTSQYTPGISIEGTTNNTGTATTIYDSTKNFTNEGNAGNIAVGDILYNKDTNQYSKVLSFSTYTVVTDQSIWGSSGINYRVENSNAARGKIALISAGWTITDGGAYIPPVVPLQLQFTVASNTQTTIDIPYVQGTSFTVDWGDGFTETNTGSNNRTISHTYNDGNNNNVTNPTVSINAQGDVNPLTGFNFSQSGGGSRTLLIDIPAWGNTPFTYVQGLLSGCSNLNTLSATDAPILSTSNFNSMLSGTGTLGNADLTSWDVSSATYTGYMFSGSQFNGNISNWDVSNVTNMAYMFSSSVFTGDLTNWDVSNVATSNHMFNGGSSNPDIAGWDMAAANNQYFWAWSNTAFNPSPFLIGHTVANQNWKYMNNQSAWTTNNWTDFLVLNANAANARSPKTPTGADFTSNSTGYRTVDTTRTYSGTGFQNAGRAISFLSADVTVSGGSSAFNGVYGYNYTTQKWVKDGDTTKTIEWNATESMWEVLNSGVSQYQGTGGTQGNGPESSTSWTGGITVVDSSLGWTLFTSIIA